MTGAGAARAGAGLLALAAGAAGMAALAAAAAGVGSKAIAVVGLAFAVALVAIILRDLTFVLLGLLVLAISYNRQFYTFDSVVGDYGPGGLYWTLADLVSLAVLGALLLSAAGGPTPGRQPRTGLTVEPALFLMMLAVALSSLGLEKIVPGIVETARITKYLAIFLLVRAVLTRERAWAIYGALALLVLLQAALGFVQAALGAGGSGLSAISEQTGEMARRATGTLGHPNMYAPFLLTFVPGFAAVAMLRYPPPLRLAALAVAGAGALAILLSQSRVPTLGLALAIAATAVTLSVRRLLPARQVLGGGVMLAFLAILAAAPLADRIAARLTGDFGGSIAFRMGYNDAALAIWQSSPIFGVGPFGFVPALSRIDPDEAATNQAIQESRLTANVKTIAPVHNVYLWILAELGIVGLAALLVLLASLARLFFAAGARGAAPPDIFFVGVFWGFAATVVQQVTDFSLWWDHHMALLMLLAALASFQCDSPRRST